MLANMGNKTLIANPSKADKKPSPRRETREPSAGKHAGQLNAATHTPVVPILSNVLFIYY
jgi:hypothetical protein